MPNNSAQFSPCSLLAVSPSERQKIGCGMPPFFTTFCQLWAELGGAGPSLGHRVTPSRHLHRYSPTQQNYEQLHPNHHCKFAFRTWIFTRGDGAITVYTTNVDAGASRVSAAKVHPGYSAKVSSTNANTRSIRCRIEAVCWQTRH